jgi:hypothetical protein
MDGTTTSSSAWRPPLPTANPSNGKNSSNGKEWKERNQIRVMGKSEKRATKRERNREEGEEQEEIRWDLSRAPLT